MPVDQEIPVESDDPSPATGGQHINLGSTHSTAVQSYDAGSNRSDAVERHDANNDTDLLLFEGDLSVKKIDLLPPLQGLVPFPKLLVHVWDVSC